MTRAERNKIIKWADTLTDEDLEKQYYDAANLTLGSQSELMYEQGWDMQDIIEREKHEKWLCHRAVLLEMLCCERGIKLWGEYHEQSKT